MIDYPDELCDVCELKLTSADGLHSCAACLEVSDAWNPDAMRQSIDAADARGDKVETHRLMMMWGTLMQGHLGRRKA